jgi:hypothetical protein
LHQCIGKIRRADEIIGDTTQQDRHQPVPRISINRPSTSRPCIKR